jgi:hypothetical protein
MGALLVSPFNVEWGCYAGAVDVEVSEFCLFLMVFPTRPISSISPRFYFRKHAFCFLPLVAFLESLLKFSVIIFFNAYLPFPLFFGIPIVNMLLCNSISQASVALIIFILSVLETG